MKALPLTAPFAALALAAFSLPAVAQEPAQGPAAEEPAQAAKEPAQAAEEPAQAAEEPAQAAEEPAQAAEEPAQAPAAGKQQGKSPGESAAEGPSAEASPINAPAALPAGSTTGGEAQDTITGPIIRFDQPLPAGPSPEPPSGLPPEGEGSSRSPHKGKNSAPFGGAMRVGVDLTGVRNSDDEYQLFGDTNVSFRPGVHVGFDLFEIGPGWMLAPEVGGRVEVADTGTRMPELHGKELTNLEGFVAVRLRTPLLPFLEGYGRVEGGLSFTRATLHSDTWPRETYESTAVGPGLQVGGGLSIAPSSKEPAGQRTKLGLGLNLEGGYQLTPALDLELTRGTPADQRFRVAQVDLGSLSRSGPYVKASGFFRF